MIFEMDVEVRPEFAVAEYKGLKVKRPIKAIRDQDVEVRSGDISSGMPRSFPSSRGKPRSAITSRRISRFSGLTAAF